MLREMDYVYAVYQEKSFSKAAKKLFVSQPALSRMVKKAEDEIGAPIFDRSTLPITTSGTWKNCGPDTFPWEVLPTSVPSSFLP